MGKLIDAHDFEIRIMEESEICEDCAYMVVNLLDDAPAVDAVQVVRCKDCKHKNEYECNKLTVSGVKVGVNDNWFCADGERKDGDLGG